MASRWTKVATLAMTLVGALLAPTNDAAATSGVILVRGSKMYNSESGERFFIKGVGYKCLVL